MSGRTRVLTADDSELVQDILRSIIGADEELQLIGSAANGRQAVELAARLRPDVIIMDVDMPELGGLEATERIMAYHPTPILVLTSLERADVAFEALARGAVEVIEKPELDDSSCRALVEMIKLSARVQVVTHLSGRRHGGPGVRVKPRPRAGAQTPAASGVVPLRPDARGPRVVGIGSSTGGPKALAEICRCLPADFPASLLIVQHIADGFVPLLGQWLDSTADITVKEAEHGELLAPGVAYVAPSGVHMELAGGRIALNEGAPVDGHRPSADVLLTSIAQHCGRHGIGVVLSGMGRDGARGLLEIRRAGGHTVAQNEETCVVFGMPRAAAELDDAMELLDPQAIAADLLRRVQPEELT